MKRGAVEYDENGNTIEICISADDVVDHMMHIGYIHLESLILFIIYYLFRELIGWDYVGIGADYNGAEDFPYDGEDVSSYPLVFGKLIERLENQSPTYSDTEIESIVQRVARYLHNFFLKNI